MTDFIAYINTEEFALLTWAYGWPILTLIICSVAYFDRKKYESEEKFREHMILGILLGPFVHFVVTAIVMIGACLLLYWIVSQLSKLIIFLFDTFGKTVNYLNHKTVMFLYKPKHTSVTNTIELVEKK